MNPALHDIIQVITQVKEKITDSDFTWTRYEESEELLKEINNHLIKLKVGDIHALEAFNLHFLPTGTFQEHSIANGWSEEYLFLAKKFEKSYKELKNQSRRIKQF